MRLAYIIFLIALFTLGCDPDKPQVIPQTLPDPQILVAHNKWRSFVGVADLEWSDELAKKAMALLDNSTCLWIINTEGLGQNSTRGRDSQTPEEVIDFWANIGFQDYIYDIDSCISNELCDWYKQIVWANSTILGCASVTCLNTGQRGWVCLYNPPGNIPGEKPY